MTFYKTTAALGATACLLMASSAFGTALVSNTFEDGASDVGATWTGDAAVATDTVTVPTPAGLPISNSAGTKVLSVTGSATNSNFSASNTDTLVDMMVKVSIPDEALAALDTTASGDAFGAKFAVAVDTTTVNDVTKGVFKFWDTSLATPAWTALSGTYDDGAWVRLTMKFYYSTGKCVVALDGNTCGEYPLIASASTLASIEVKGSTSLDEVLVTQDTMVAAFADTTATESGIKKSWLTKYNVPWSSASGNAPDYSTSGLTVAQKYAFGLDPTDGSKFALDFVQNSSPTTATLSFPGFGAYGGAGAYYLDTSSDNSSWTPGATALTVSGTGVNIIQEVDLPSNAGQAVYYRVRAAASN